MSETRFAIAVPHNELQHLRAKLDLTVFPDELDDAGWQYGVPLADVKRLVAYWKEGFDWRKHEADLNKELPQYTRDIVVDGHGTLNIHYIHKKSSVVDAIPLLFVHGWPGSFIEARKILPLLTAALPDQPSFHVVALSLPGFGFSEAPKKKGFRVHQYAEVGHKLMLALGYNEYPFVIVVTQGGDWGAFVTKTICSQYGGKHAKSWHSNFPLSKPPHPIYEPISYILYALKPYTKREKAGLERRQWFERISSGYFAEQSTQPQTLGYALADSPAGLLAWIYEKLVSWTDSYPWTDDEVLTWLSIYWFSRAGPAATIRIYYEVIQSGDLLTVPSPKVPIGYSFFPEELVTTPQTWIRSDGENVFEAHHDHGGHFAAFERPDDLVGDLRKMFGKGGPAFGVVPGKIGYA